MWIPLSTFSFQRKEPCMTPLRQRYLQDLQLRNYSPKTQEVYVECVSLFARHFGKSPELLGPEDIRTYQLYLAHEKKASWSRFNQTVCALRFLLDHPAHPLSPPGKPAARSVERGGSLAFVGRHCRAKVPSLADHDLRHR